MARRPSFDRPMFDRWFADRRPALVERLVELVAIPTVSPDEEAAYPWLTSHVERLGGRTVVEPPPEGIERHPAFTVTGLAAPLRPNLRASFAAPAPDAPRLLFNAHVDVVPAGRWRAAFAPVVDDGEVVGRGAADTKNNIVMLLGALEFLRDCSIDPAYHVFADFVVEEEIGGNGTLASVLNGSPAGEVLVLEPTSLAVFRGHRGCLSFEVHVRGEGAHMGSGATGLSAIDGATVVLERLRRLEASLAAAARDDPAFAALERPTPINVGFIRGGEWHGSYAERCEIRGNIGFAPRHELDDVRRMLETAVATLPEPWGRGRCTVTYSGIHNEPYVTEADSALVRRAAAAVGRQAGPVGAPSGWSASCDARYYSRLLGLPVVIFGCGSLARAHSNEERVSVAELELGMRSLCDLLTTPPEER